MDIIEQPSSFLESTEMSLQSGEGIIYQCVSSEMFRDVVQKGVGYRPVLGNLEEISESLGLKYLSYVYDDMIASTRNNRHTRYAVVALDAATKDLLGYASVIARREGDGFSFEDQGHSVSEISVRFSHRGRGISYGLLDAVARIVIDEGHEAPRLRFSTLSDDDIFCGRVRLIGPLTKLFYTYPALQLSLSYSDREAMRDSPLHSLNTLFASRKI